MIRASRIERVILPTFGIEAAEAFAESTEMPIQEILEEISRICGHLSSREWNSFYAYIKALRNAI